MVELFCGLGGATEGAMAEGFRCVGFDIEVHDYGTGGYPGELVLQDVLTIHGKQFKDATFIWASPPCQEFSYMAMPWSRGKQIADALRGRGEFPSNYTGSRTVAELTALFDACFRIQREASEAAGRYIPMVVENVRGAQPWVGRAPWNYGSFYLWGDVPALMPFTYSKTFKAVGPQNTNGEIFRQSINKMRDCLKVPGLNFHEYEKTGKPGRSFQSAAVELSRSDGMKGEGGAWFNDYKSRKDRGGNIERLSCTSSKSPARKAASAQIAKIPFELARWIAHCFKP